MRVDFMMIGAQKAGTTSLAAQMASHPQICFCKEKEPGYFNKSPDWEAGLDKYHDLYNPQPGQICGEASTQYTFIPEYLGTHRRLHEYNPDLKLIYIMRQPVERTISHYTHHRVRELDTRPAEIAVFADPAYVNRSRYGVQIRPYLELFGREKVLLLVFEEYTADQFATLERIAEFLGIDASLFGKPEIEPLHQSVGRPYLRSGALREFTRTGAFQKVRDVVPASIRQPIRHRLFSNKIDEKPYFAPEIKNALWRLLEDDVCAVEEMLGARLDIWRRDYTDGRSPAGAR